MNDSACPAVSGKPEFVALWHQVNTSHNAARTTWITALRSIGIKACHPDDGWVDRSHPYHDWVTFCYPQFDDGVKVGDMIALGWPDRYRVRRVIEIKPAGLLRGKQYVVAR